MLATLVIGLREGLEAALIVGIIAAFLRRSGRPLVAMWVGVVLAVAVSALIAIALLIVEASLPQVAQDGMEAIVGVIAVVFVTSMLVWMSGHARFVKRDLEISATRALGSGTSRALAVMAFLAVLKEGFETSVFLIATFRAATDPGLAAGGAVLGLVIAVAAGVGIYRGSVRLNLSRFYRWTSPFLVLLAAGLLVTALREAHGAGWVDGGQQPTIDLSWLAPRGSVQGALITGVLGVPPDPRLVEVAAWLAYVIPTALFVYWPSRSRPSGRRAHLLSRYVAGALLLAALVIALVVPRAEVAPTALPLTGGGTARVAGSEVVATRPDGETRLPLRGQGTSVTQNGVSSTTWARTSTTRAAVPRSIELDRLIELSGGRVPVGISRTTSPGPFTAQWTVRTRTSATTAGSVLIDASQASTVLVTLSGGGLTASRTYTVPESAIPSPPSWHVAPNASTARRDALTAASLAAPDHQLWGVQLPLLLLLIAGGLLALSILPERRTSQPAAGPARTSAVAAH